jgi:probable rRNA maturation factor
MSQAISAEVSVDCPAWLSACPDAEELAEAAARAALAGRAGRLIVGIVLSDDAAQQELNRTYRGKDVPTNVLSFSLADPVASRPAGAPILLGDVILAFETVVREAAAQHKPLPDHLRHLVVHGVLHLLGFDHETEADAAVMEAREVEILTGLGVPDPYRDIM